MVKFVSTLPVAQGHGRGGRLQVWPWEEDFLRAVEQHRYSALSVSRGAGKTTVCASLAVAALRGPLAEPESQIIAVAGKFKQARLLYKHVLRFMRPTINRNPDRWRIWDSNQAARIEDRETGIYFEAREAEPEGLHGEATRLALLDEPRKWRATTAQETYHAIRGGLGKIENSRLVALGTRPAQDEHWFLSMVDNPGPHTHVSEFRANPDDDPGDVATWERANPSISHNPILRRFYEDEWAEVQLDPARMPSFRSDWLNMGVSDVVEQMLVAADQWADVEVDIQPAARGPICSVST